MRRTFHLLSLHNLGGVSQLIPVLLRHRSCGIQLHIRLGHILICKMHSILLLNLYSVTSKTRKSKQTQQLKISSFIVAVSMQLTFSPMCTFFATVTTLTTNVLCWQGWNIMINNNLDVVNSWESVVLLIVAHPSPIQQLQQKYNEGCWDRTLTRLHVWLASTQ